MSGASGGPSVGPAGRLALLAAFVVGGCGLFFSNPTVRILDVRVASLGLTSGSAQVELEVVNPNRYGLRLQTFEYVLEVDGRDGGGGWTEVAAGSSEEEIRVAGRDTAVVSLDVPFGYRAVQGALGAYLRDGELAYRFRGGAVVRGPLGRVEVPFDRRGRW